MLVRLHVPRRPAATRMPISVNIKPSSGLPHSGTMTRPAATRCSTISKRVSSACRTSKGQACIAPREVASIPEACPQSSQGGVSASASDGWRSAQCADGTRGLRGDRGIHLRPKNPRHAPEFYGTMPTGHIRSKRCDADGPRHAPRAADRRDRARGLCAPQSSAARAVLEPEIRVQPARLAACFCTTNSGASVPAWGSPGAGSAVIVNRAWRGRFGPKCSRIAVSA